MQSVFIKLAFRIGDNSIIVINSLVTKDVGPFSVVGGVPSKLMRYRKLNA